MLARISSFDISTCPTATPRQRTYNGVCQHVVSSPPSSNESNVYLLELELDHRANVGDLVSEVLLVRDGGGELSSLGETGAEETRDLLDEDLGREEGVVLLGELLDELLVLVELLQVVDRHVLEFDELGAVNVGGIGENADRHARAGDVREPVTIREYQSLSLSSATRENALDGSRETLVTLGIVVLETDLELDL